MAANDKSRHFDKPAPFHTPQAVDDDYSYAAQALAEPQSDGSLTLTFDVLANDLGGNAKTLWAVTDRQDGVTVGIADGKIDYRMDGAALARIDALGAGKSLTDVLSYTIRLGNGVLSFAELRVTFTGTNDAPVLSIQAGDSDSAGIAETDAGLAAGGTLTLRDVDTSDMVDTAVTGFAATGNTGGLGDDELKAMFAITAGASDLAADSGDAGNLAWAFDSGSADFDHLTAGQTLVLAWTMTGSDGNGGSATGTVSVVITGTNDAAVINGQRSGRVVEDAAAETVSGNLDATDVDGEADSWMAVTAPALSASGYGTFTIDAAGAWSYTLDNAHPAMARLDTGAGLSDSFTVLTADGTAATVAIAIGGHTDIAAMTLPAAYTGTGDPNDFDRQLGAGSTSKPLISGTNTGETINGRSGATAALSADTINALDGNDTVNAGEGADLVLGGNGADTLDGGNGDDKLYGQPGDDLLFGGANQDELYGGSGDDTLDGGANNDPGLYGGSGADTITGGDNNDNLVGGYGADTLTGGNGFDTFTFLSKLDTNDTILDFSHVQDRFDLMAFDGNDDLPGLQLLKFNGTTPGAYSVWSETVGGNTVIYADTNGSIGSAELMITLIGIQQVDTTDFAGLPI